jgi:alkylhydroperoxidase/carboxymuconolactone decarboxylase family protein YurZ
MTCQAVHRKRRQFFQDSLEGAGSHPYSDRMTHALTDSITAAVEAVAAITDPVERYKDARERRTELNDGDRSLMLIQQAVAQELKEGRTWAHVGELLEVTGSRAEQIAKGR